MRKIKRNQKKIWQQIISRQNQKMKRSNLRTQQRISRKSPRISKIKAESWRGNRGSVPHPILLGAHRYTTYGGVCALRGPLRGAVVSLRLTKGEATLPLRFASLHYPLVYFSEDIALKIRAPSSEKSVGLAPRGSPTRHTKPRTVRFSYGY